MPGKTIVNTHLQDSLIVYDTLGKINAGSQDTLIKKFNTDTTDIEQQLSIDTLIEKPARDSVFLPIVRTPASINLSKAVKLHKPIAAPQTRNVPDTAVFSYYHNEHKPNAVFLFKELAGKEICRKPDNLRVFAYTETKYGDNNIVLDPVLRADNNPDWLLGVFFVILILLARIRLYFGKYIIPIIYSGISIQSFQNLYRNRNSHYIQAGINFHLIFFLTTGLFLFQMFGIYWPEPGRGSPPGIRAYLVIILILAGWLLLKYIVHWLIGLISDEKSLFNENYHSVLLYNKTMGVFLIPVVLGLAYIDSPVSKFLVYAGVGIIIIIYILRIFRLIILFISNRVSIFYSIMYLCALEILPVLILFRILFPLK